MDVRYPNPPAHLIRTRDDLGSIWDAARAAGVRPGTIRVWIHRRKISPVDLGDDGPELFHLPTVLTAAQAGRRHTPPDPAANARAHRAA
ncbi:hypothetical protein [Wenjunlia vitaminophila]|uniref:hypothetical protein n=1 Tax=Wenjunlia vitaminophila TaxID=76728 RepID=UPI0003691E5B|nr:hypothetical protein [Wenjunlia vitaminophila]